MYYLIPRTTTEKPHKDIHLETLQIDKNRIVNNIQITHTRQEK